MELYAVFRNTEKEIHAEHCVVDKVLELTENEFSQFLRAPFADHDFIVQHKDFMCQDADGTWHSLLALGKNREDGVLVAAEGHSYAFLPNARQLYLLGQYPSLKEFNRRMAETAERYAQQAVNRQQDGMYRIWTDELALEKNEDDLFLRMLKERPEIADLENWDGELCMKLTPEYVAQEKELPKLDQDEADIMCAKHVLWLYGVGGERASFSGYDLSELNLSHRNLNNAVFVGCRMRETNLEQTELCFSDFTDATLVSCDLRWATVEEVSFKRMVADGCNFQGASLIHSNFTGARIHSCHMEQTNWMKCCVDCTEFSLTPMEQANMDGVNHDEQDWSQGAGANLTM